MILAGVAVVVPGVLVDNISLPVTIAMQVCYASLIGLGVLLAFDEKPEAGMNMNINLKETVCSLKN
jgi:hydrogenase/urease accessory protein HupE